jgi:hypothetical protein
LVVVSIERRFSYVIGLFESLLHLVSEPLERMIELDIFTLEGLLLF